MALDAATNFGYATLAAGIDSDDTSITLTAGHGARLPSTAFNAPIWDTSYGSPTLAYHAGAAEIVRVTARSTDTLTVTRAQEGTTARSFNTSGRTYAIGVALTKATYDQLAPSASPTFTGPVTTTGATIATASAMGGTVIDVTKRWNSYSATGDVTLTFSATPATGTEFGLLVTTDSSTPTIAYPESQSANRGANITSSTFPANMTTPVVWRREASGYRIIGDPVTAAQVKSALAITVDDITGTLSVAKGGTGTSTPSIVAGSNVSVTGTWPNQTVSASGGGGSSNVMQGGNATTDFTYVETIGSGNASTDFSTLAVVHGANASVTF